MIGEVIYNERKKRNWTQAELAKRSKIKQPVLVRYEKGGQYPSPRNLKKLADAFRVPVNFFIETEKAKGKLNEIEFDRKLKAIKTCAPEIKLIVDSVLTLALTIQRHKNAASEYKKVLGD